MRNRTILAVLVLAATAAPAGARPVKASGPPSAHCRVVGGEKLPAGSGGAGAICAAIEAAVAAAAPKAHYSVEVNVLRPWMLAATPVVNGRTLPVQKFAVSDAELGAASIRRFARALASAVAAAAKA